MNFIEGLHFGGGVMYPYPIKDWRDASLYENSSYLSGSQWAWEFLRRNGQYQESFDKYSPLAVGKMNHSFYVLDRVYDVDVRPIFKAAKKYGLAGDMVCDFPNPRHRAYCIFWSKLEGFEYSSLLKVLPSGIFPDGVRHPSFDNGQPIAPKNENEIVIKFDLRRSLKDQLEVVKKLSEFHSHLRGVQPLKARKRVTKGKRGLHVNYLRVLDALADNASKSEMIEVIAANKSNDYDGGKVARSNIDNWIKSAVALRDGGYLDMLRIPR